MMLVTLIIRVPLVKRIQYHWTLIARDDPDDLPPSDAADLDVVAVAAAALVHMPSSSDN